MADVSKKYIDARVLNKIRNLELRARQVMEGFVAGMHKSPYHGFSVEFAEHREYTQGDDLRHLDWKVFGRSNRLYLKEYELETNLRSHILVDTSESMEYKSGEVSKLDLACFIAASLGYLIIHQQDAVGLVCFDKEIGRFIPPSSNPAHISPVLAGLAESSPKNKGDIAAVLHSVAERIKHRGMIILISDLFDNPQKVLNGLQHLRHRRHDVIVLHIMDEHEVSFPFQRMTLFEGLEQYPEVLCDPRSVKKEYLEEVEKFINTIRRGCMQQQMDYELITTNRPLDVALSKYLETRLGTRMKK